MIDLLYIVIIAVFSLLSAVTLIQVLIQGGSLREQWETLFEQVAQQEEQIDVQREELAEVAFDSDLLNQEKNAFESQKNCMTQIEVAHLTSADSQ
jgi:hypothetical protein